MTKAGKRYYAVVKGRKPGIYTTWNGPSGAQVQVKGFPGAVFKGFASRPEAEQYFREPPAPERRNRSLSQEPSRHERQLKDDEIHVYTDGGCINNPGPGGWAAVILKRNQREEISGGYRLTTNNRMELQACIQALRMLPKGSTATFFTDSQYVVNAVEKGWARGWRSRNWMRDKTHRAENADLWAELLGLLEDHRVSFQWVRGHAGNPENERCDELARSAATGRDLIVDEAYESLQGIQG